MVLSFETIPQPEVAQVSDALQSALGDTRYTTLRAAVAYVTSSGVHELQQALGSSPHTIQWLTSFDWCRSEPAALDALNQRGSSVVRIHDGKHVVARKGCVPGVSFHPKVFLFSGPTEALLVLGSANLSRNGLRLGVEFDTRIEISGRSSSTAEAWLRIERARQWFDRAWIAASQYQPLARQYSAEYARRAPGTAVLEFGDTSSTVGRGFTAEQLAQVARAQTMWIQAGNLTARANLTPGHQLMMRPMTRVFFGFSAAPAPRMTRIGEVTVRFDGILTPGLSLEFAHNSMDRLNLPGSSRSGTARYDGETLKFTKAAVGGAVVFDLVILNANESRRLRTASAKLDLEFSMTSGRTFGFV